MQTAWKLVVWRSGDKVFRHWIAPDLASEWARRFLSARTLFEQCYCWRRWWEAANLGGYAVRAVGIDVTAAPRSAFTIEGPPGLRGLPVAPATLAAALPDSGQVRGGFVQPYLQGYPRGQRREVYAFGAVGPLRDGSAIPSQGNRPYDVRRVAVLSSEGQSSERFERRLSSMLRDARATMPADLVGEIKRASPGWWVSSVPIVPGLRVAVQWVPVVFDGFYRVVWLDADEERERSTLLLADLSRTLYPEAWEDPETGLSVLGVPVPLEEMPDAERKRAEIQEYLRDPWGFLERYTAAIVERNWNALRATAPAFASQAEAASKDAATALAVSSAALDVQTAAQKNELVSQINDVGATLGAVPVIGTVAQGFVDVIAFFFRALWNPERTPEERAAALRAIVVPLSISGSVSPEPGRARAPVQSLFAPYGVARLPAVPLPAGAAVLAESPTSTVETAGPDPTAPPALRSSSKRAFASRMVAWDRSLIEYAASGLEGAARAEDSDSGLPVAGMAIAAAAAAGFALYFSRR